MPGAGVSKPTWTKRRASASTGSFSWTVSTGDIFWSKEGYRMLELDRTGQPSIDVFLQRVHQDDRQVVQHEIDRARQGDQEFDYEHRWLMPNGADEASPCPRPPRAVRIG